MREGQHLQYQRNQDLLLIFSTNLDYYKFANQIAKKSNVDVFIVKNQYEIAKFLKNHLKSKNIVIGMGAGSISNWIKQLPELMKE